MNYQMREYSKKDVKLHPGVPLSMACIPLAPRARDTMKLSATGLWIS